MDVMKPNIIWIKDRCYRLYGQTPSSRKNVRGYGDDEGDFADNEWLCGNEGSDDEYDVQPTESGRMQTAFHVPRCLHGILVGFKGTARQRLEKETKTLITIPKKGLTGDIVVSGPTREGVVQARRRMELMVLAARQKQQFTHFLSIPMNSDDIKTGFLKFKEQVLENHKGRGISGDVFQEPAKLHLTLGTLSLLDDLDRKRAASAFQECLRDVIMPLLNHQSLRLMLSGVDFMNDDPAEVDVLYGKVQDVSEVPIVQELADSIVHHMSKTGLMPKQHDAVKLHLTLMNSVFRHSDGKNESIEGRPKKIRETFDAASILKEFQNYKFGDISVKNIDLSRRYSTAANGYYEATTSVVIQS